MFDVIVWATDGSENADLALEHVKRIASEAGTSRVVAVHVKEMAIGRSAGYPVRVDEQEIEEKVRGQVEELKGSGIEGELQVAPAVAGGAAHALADVAREAGADVIVVGTRGQGPIAGLLLGSVTHRLLHVATCPVLAIPPGERATG